MVICIIFVSYWVCFMSPSDGHNRCPQRLSRTHTETDADDSAAQSEANAEMAAMLAQVAKSIGLEWNTPTCPECLRLDNWFLVSEHDT